MKPVIIILADIYDSNHSLPEEFIQEWESKDSIGYLINALHQLGHESILIEPLQNKDLVLSTLKEKLEFRENYILWNLVEGFQSRNRESWVPSIAEFMGFPYTGSDVFAQNVSLNKFLTKKLATDIGINTANYCLLEKEDSSFGGVDYPVFIKPNEEGSSLGISEENIVHNSNEFESKIGSYLKKYRSVLVEEYLSGDDITCGVIGNYPNYTATLPARILYPSTIYSQSIKSKAQMPERLEFDLDRSIANQVQSDSIAICNAIKADGFARVDFKLGQNQKPYFLEINLTPGLSYKYSSFPICYQNSLGDYQSMIEKIISLSIEKYNNTEKNIVYGRF